MGDIQLTALTLGMNRTNCYLLTNARTKETVIVDPAGDFPAIAKKITGSELLPKAVILTHGHFDHIGAAAETRDAYQIPIYAAAVEKALLADPNMNGSAMFGGPITIEADNFVNDNDELSQAGISISVIATPGHTAGSVCYHIAGENILLSGDTLFRGSIGRTDVPTADHAMILHSIKDKLFTLPDTTGAYPGHGEKTSIGYEKKYNMFFR